MMRQFNTLYGSPVLRWGLGAAALCLVVWAVSGQLGDLALLGSIRAATLLVLALLPIISLCALGHTQALLLRSFGVRLTWIEVLGLQSLLRVGNVMGPSVGVVARALYLKKVHGLPYSLAGSLIAGTTVVSVFVLAMFLGVGLAGMYLAAGFVDLSLLLFGVSLGTAALVVIFFPLRLGPSEHRWANVFAKFVNGWRDLLQRRVLLMKASFYRLAILVLCCVGYALCLHDMGCRVQLFQVVTVVAVSQLFTVLPITPGSIGIAEGAVVLSASILGIDAGRAFALAVALRISRTLALVPFVGLVLYLRLQFGRPKIRFQQPRT